MSKYQVVSKKDETNVHTFDTIKELRDALATDDASALTGMEIMYLSLGRSVETKVCTVNVV